MLHIVNTIYWNPVMKTPPRVHTCSARRAFSLIELLTVMAMVALLTTFTAFSLTSAGGAGRLSSALAQAAGYIDQVRNYAIANSTYAYVGYRVTDAPEIRVVLVAVASNSGDDLSSSTEINPTATDTAVQIGRPLQLNGVSFASANATFTPALQKVSSRGEALPTGLQLTVGGQSYTALAAFGPSGSVSFQKTVPPLLEFALLQANRPTHAGLVQISGLTGLTRVFRQ